MPRLEAVGQTIAMDATDNPPIVAGDDSRWMTFAELAKARGISRLSAERLVRRHKWRRQPGNDGRTRVLVPSGSLKADERKTDRESDRGRLLAIVQTALAAQERAESRAVVAETSLAAALARADSAETALAAREAELAKRKRGFLARLSHSWRQRRGL